ncbi:MAG TPA: oxidoreductase, partial [Planctomycetaceae bacterium]|nr:oxidoreductase [Planctomycetaceae bacterium]
MPSLFDQINLRDITVRNRIGLSPMSLYSGVDGEVSTFDLVHYGARAIGGAGLIFT